MAAVRTAEQLRRAEYAGAITIVSDEQHLPYDRPPLSKAFLEPAEDVPEIPTFRDETYLRDELRAINVIPSLPATEVARTRWSPN